MESQGLDGDSRVSADVARQARATPPLPARFHSPRRSQQASRTRPSRVGACNTPRNITMASIISRTLRRAVLDSRGQLPPTFLLPWTANLSTAANATEKSNDSPSTLQHLAHMQSALDKSLAEKPKKADKSAAAPASQPAKLPTKPAPPAQAGELRFTNRCLC